MAEPFLRGDRIVQSFYASSNLAASNSKYQFVRLIGSMTVDHCPSGTDGCATFTGVLESCPSATGESCEVCIGGVTKAIAGAAITAGADFIVAVNNTAAGYVYPVSSGAVYAASAGTYYTSGVTLTRAAAASEVISVLVKWDREII